MSKKYSNPFKHLLAPGHTACPGCGMIIAARTVVDAAGENTIIANATGCSEVTTTKFNQSSWKVPWIHATFENPASVAEGIRAALDSEGKKDINVIAQGGDGAFYDIGIGALSGSWARNANVLFVCFDNENYANTGYQASGATPHDSYTMTSPAGKKSSGNQYYKKNLAQIAIAHGLSYVATCTVANPLDITNKVKKALTKPGAKYIQIFCPCIPGWGIDDNKTVEVSKLAQQTGLCPVFEAENGEITNKMKVPDKETRPKVTEYLKYHKRFTHLFKSPNGKEEIKHIQAVADKNVEKYKLDQ